MLFRSGTLAKSVAKHDITSFVYLGFIPSDPPPTNEPQPQAPSPQVETNWFETQLICKAGNKKRGRPRKYLPKVNGVTVHKIEDIEADQIFCPTVVSCREYLAQHQHVCSKINSCIERNFKMFLKTMDVREALEELSLKFHLQYKQAYELVSNYI